MTLTKDELARLAELEDLLTVGLVEQPINGSVLSWGEAALIAHRIGRHLLRDAPVADTAGPATERDAITRDRIWASGYSAGRAAASRAVADTAGIDAAWREAEAALPDKWTVSISAGYSILGPTHAYHAGARMHGAQGGIGASGPTPAAALLALAAALRTPKPEGDR